MSESSTTNTPPHHQVSFWVCPMDKHPASYPSYMKVPLSLGRTGTSYTHQICFPSPEAIPRKCDTSTICKQPLPSLGYHFVTPLGSLSCPELTQGICFELVFFPQMMKNLCWFFPRRPLVSSVHWEAWLGFRQGPRWREPALPRTEPVISLAQGSNQRSHQAHTSFRAVIC